MLGNKIKWLYIFKKKKKKKKQALKEQEVGEKVIKLNSLKSSKTA